MFILISIALLFLQVSAQGGGGGGGGGPPPTMRFPTKIPTSRPSITPTTLSPAATQRPSTPTKIPTNSPSSYAVDFSCKHYNSWIMNGGHYSSIFGTLTEILTLTYASGSYTISHNRIPYYNRTLLASDILSLNSRPKAASDFKSGITIAQTGRTYEFGSNIGYSSTACTKGYWPPGPVCPSASSVTTTFTLNPAPEISSSGCYGGMAALGRTVNGVAIYGPSDGMTYSNGGVWHNLAPKLEAYDVDICGGHAANGEYHHHSFSQCLADRIGDTGSSHSPIYGWIIDGFPVYGPYHSAGVKVTSCWQKREYTSTSPTGCGTNGARTCLLVDQWDYTKGTKTTTSTGPTTSTTVTSLSSNTFLAVSGLYFEDYYYNTSCTNQGGSYLDSHNGHDHDTYGYHYHFTVDSNGDSAFPFIFGPKYYGCVSSSSSCCSSFGANGCSSTSTCGTKVGVATASQACTSGSTKSPTILPTRKPTRTPSIIPTTSPTVTFISPTRSPTSLPSSIPTRLPSQNPTTSPSTLPTQLPSRIPSVIPSSIPTRSPSSTTLQPSRTPSLIPSRAPTRVPTLLPSRNPSRNPSDRPSRLPSRPPTTKPSRKPSSIPTRRPTSNPTNKPSRKPTAIPSAGLAGIFTSQPTNVKGKHHTGSEYTDDTTA